MIKKLAIILLMLSVTSCASLNPVDALNPMKESGINATAQVGAENTAIQNKSLAQDNSSHTNFNDNKAEQINQHYDYQMPPWILLLIVGLAGIAIENPFGIMRRKKDRELLETLIKEKVHGGESKAPQAV